MEWVETPEKGRNASVLLQEFEERFARLSALDRTILDTIRVLMSVKLVDARDREQVGLLLDDGLTADWAVVKRVCGRFDKRRDWVDKDSSGAGTVATRKLQGAPPVRREETRDWLETGSTSTIVVKGPYGGAALEELTQMVRGLQIAQARRDGGEQALDWRRPACIDAYGATRLATPGRTAGISPTRLGPTWCTSGTGGHTTMKLRGPWT